MESISISSSGKNDFNTIFRKKLELGVSSCVQRTKYFGGLDHKCFWIFLRKFLNSFNEIMLIFQIFLKFVNKDAMKTDFTPYWTTFRGLVETLHF